jgi:uncharacterized hydantoinase/oxoprolinase family protein
MTILQQRQKTHGEYSQVASLAQALKTRIRAESRNLTAQQQESIEMICVKIARIVCGDASEIDHWRDIAGYAELIYKKKRAGSGEFTQEEPPDESSLPSIDGPIMYLNPR